MQMFIQRLHQEPGFVTNRIDVHEQLYPPLIQFFFKKFRENIIMKFILNVIIWFLHACLNIFRLKHAATS